MQAVIVDNQWLQLHQVVGPIETLLTKQFSAKHPRSNYINDTSQQSWDGWYRKYYAEKQRLAMPFLSELKKLCADNNIPLSVIDKRPKVVHPVNQADIKPDILNGITLEDHQMRAITAACSGEHDCGLISVVTGGGKTEIAAAITKLYGLPTVIVADQRVVIEQIKERLELRGIGDSDGVGLFYGGETPSGQMVVVGSIQSMQTPPSSLKAKNPQQYQKRKQNAKVFQQIVSQAGLLLVDECDKATDTRYRALFKKYFTGRYKFGFSGTCFDAAKPVEGLILREHLGSIIVEVGRRELEAIGRIIPVKAMMISVGKDLNDRNDKMAYDIAQRELILENTEYHQTIKKIVSAYPGERNLVLVDTNNVEDLGFSLEKLIDNSVFIYGKSTKTARHAALEAFKDGKLSCLIGGKILKRGLDIKGGVHNLIICGGGKLASDFDQKIGRAVRNNDRGWARVICFFHFDNYYLYNHSKQQLKTIVSLGYKCAVSIKGTIIDGADLVQRNFRFPKGLIK